MYYETIIIYTVAKMVLICVLNTYALVYVDPNKAHLFTFTISLLLMYTSSSHLV
jgi:hypothetical protein